MSQTTTRRLMNSFRQLRRPQPQRLNSRRRRTAIPEVLETRTLLAADPGVSLFSPFESPDLVDAGSDAAAGLSEYVFIDAGVADSDVLAEGFDRVGTEVVMLEPDRDGWRQIAEHLEGAFELDAIHVLSHGNTGQIFLGDSVYSTANIAESETELRRIGRALNDNGDILLYGCNISSESDQLINFFASVTGGDVAASDDVTGAVGDWVLEEATGTIESFAQVSHILASSYSHSLLTTQLFEDFEDSTLHVGVNAPRQNESTPGGPINPLGTWAYSLDGIRDLAYSRIVNLAGFDSASLEYRVQAEGRGDNPESNDLLRVNYIRSGDNPNSSGNWRNLGNHDSVSSAGVNHNSFNRRHKRLPANALHANFRFVFDATDSDVTSSGVPGDDWFVDQVRLRANRAPVISLSNSYSVPDSAATQTISWSVSDADGDPLSTTVRLNNSVIGGSSRTVSPSAGTGSYTFRVDTNDGTHGGYLPTASRTRSMTLSVYDDDTAAPNITLNGSSGTEHISADQTFVWSILDASDSTSSVTVTKDGVQVFSDSYATNVSSQSFDFNSLGVGEYVIMINATDKDSDRAGDSKSGSLTRTVIVTNAAPTAVIDTSSQPAQRFVGEALDFSALLASDPDGDALDYAWDFGDGSGVSNDAVTDYAYANPGTYTVSLTVDDGFGESDTTTEDIVVTEIPPVANDDAWTTTEDDVLTPSQALLDNDSDPQGYGIEVVAINGQPLSVSSDSEIATATSDPNLPVFTTSINADNYYGFRFEVTEATTIERIGGVFQFATGTGPFAAVVALDDESDFPDSEGLSTADVLATTVIPLAFQDDGEKSAEINVDLQPGWYAAMFGTGDFGSTGITNLFLNSAPEPGITFIHSQPMVPRFLTPTPASRVPNARLFVTEAGGAFVPTDFVLPSGADLNVGPNGTLTYDPVVAFDSLSDGQQATDQFSYTVRSTSGLETSATAMVTINGINDAPTAAPQSGVVPENSLLTKTEATGLLSGANDAEGDTLVVSAINGEPLLAGTPIDLPSGAEITVNADGSFVYDPTTAFGGLTDGETGSDSLTFAIYDGNGGTSEETISITINGLNDSPEIDALTDPIVIDEGETAALSGTVSDSEIGVLNLSASVGDVNLAANDETFTWEYTPTDDASTESVVITVTDEGGRFSELLFDLSINNVEPTLILDASLSADQLAPLTLVLNNVEDPGDDTIVSATVDWGDGSSTTVDSLDDAQHVYSAAPGIYQIDVTLQDEDGTYFNVASTQVVIANAAPVIESVDISETVINEGQSVTLDVSWIDGNEAHTVIVDWGDGNLSTVNVPSSTSSRSIDYTYQDDTPFGTPQDEFEIVVTVSDGEASVSTISMDSVVRSFDGLRQIGSTGSTSVVDIAVDRFGHQYVAGSFSGELSQDGEVVATTGAANTDWYVTRYDSSGQRNWTRTIGRQSFTETLEAMAVTPDGDIVLAGSVTNSTDLEPGSAVVLPDGGDNVIVTLSSDGDFEDAVALPGVMSFTDAAVDSSGNLAVTGRFLGSIDFDPGSQVAMLESTSNFSGFVTLFDTDRQLQWARGLIGTNYGETTSVALSDNAVTVGGFFRDFVMIDSSNSATQIASNGNNDVYVAQFDSAGTHQWHAATGGSGDDRLYDLAASRDGSVFVAASARGMIDVDPSPIVFDVNLGSSARPLLWALTPDGSLAWHDDVRTSGNSSFRAVSISPNDQRVVASGTFDSLILNDDGTNIFQPSLGGFLSVYGPLGQQEYLANLTGPGFEQIDTLAVSSDGQAVFGGTFNQSIADADETQTLSVTSQNDGFLATYALTATAPLHSRLTVRNTAPVIASTSLVGDPADDSRVIYSAEFFDLGTEPDSMAVVDWGDGTTTMVTLAPEQTSLELSHRYVAGPESPANGIYDVTFTLTDKDFAIASTSQPIAVASSPEVTFDTYSLSFDEDAGAVQIPVLLSVPSAADITIPLIWGGTAVEGFDPDFADYSLVNYDVFIPSGQTSGVVTLQILDDNVDEIEPESIELTLLETSGVTLGRTPILSVEIIDNDTPILDASADATGSVWEDHGTITVTLGLSGPRDVDTLVDIFAAGSAALNSDYSISSPDLETDIDGNAVIRIPAGLSTSALQISLVNDTANETFLESLNFRFDTTDPDVQVGTDRVNLVVRDNDPLVYVGNQSVGTDYRTVVEGQSITVSVALSAPTNTDRIVPLTAYGYGALRASSNDYAVPSSVTIPAGATTVDVTVPIQEDNLDETLETFYIARAVNIGGSARGKGVYVGINDNDTSVVNVRARTSVGEGASFDVTVSLTKPSVSDVLVKIRLSGSALPNIVKTTNTGLTGLKVTLRDYGFPTSVLRKEGREAWISIPAGSQSATFPIGVNKDNIGEGNETIVMSIISASGGAQRGTGDTVNILSNRARGTLAKDVSNAPVTFQDGALVVTTRRTDVNVDTTKLGAQLSVGGTDGAEDATIDLKLPFEHVTANHGLLSNATLFFDANFNFRRDFLDLDGDGVFSDGDLTEPAFETSLDGSTFYTIPEAFDVNGDGEFDSAEGQLVIVGGEDTSVDQSFEQVLSAPMGFGIISPMSTLVSQLMRQRDIDIVAAADLTLSALELEGFALAANNYLFNVAEGDSFAGEAYRADVRVAATTRLITALFEEIAGADIRSISTTVYGNLAEKLNGSTIDFESTAFLQSVIQGTSFRLGTNVDDAVSAAAAAQIISSLQQRVSDVQNNASREYVDALATLHRTAEAELVPVIRGLATHSDPAQVAADNSGSGLDALVAATQVSNVLPPEMYVSDIAVTEGAGGTVIAEIQVGLFGGTDVPVSVAYGTLEGSATEEDSDYAPTAGVLTWQPSDAEIQTIQVLVNGDNQFEEDEFFDLRFSDADGLVMRHDFGRIFILNDDGFSFTAEETVEPTNVRVVANGNQIEVYQDDVLAFAGGISDSGPITISAFDSVETNFELEVLSAGPLLTNQIQFIGGGSALDTLVVSGTLTESSLISLTDATSGQVTFDTGTITFTGIETVLDSLSATISVDGSFTEGSLATLSASNPAFPIEEGDSLSWTVTSDNGFLMEGSGQGFEFDLGDNGNYEVELILERSGRGQVTAATAFSVTNTAPTTTDDDFSVSEDAISVTLAVLENDEDPAGAADPLLVVSIDGSSAIGTLELIDGTVSYSPNGNFESLAVDETATETFTYTIDDGDSGTDSATVTLTITGVNDTPTVTGPITAGATEDDAAFTVDLLVGASDVDLSDVLNVDVLTLTSGDDIGVTIDANELIVDPTAYNHLAVGESEVIVYGYDVIDRNGGIVPQTATITISGVNDAATVNGPVTGGSTEDDAAFSVDLLNGASDVDLSDVLVVDALTLTSGDNSGVTIRANELTVDPTTYNHLAVGESVIIVYSYNVVDGNGGTVPQTATITVSGLNDDPTVSGPVSAAATEDDAALSVDLLAGASDADLSDVLNVDALTLTSGDGSGVTIGTNELTVDPTAYNHLAVGESEVIAYSYNVVDSNGGIMPQTATITISGLNDDPAIESLVSSHSDVADSSANGSVNLSGTVRDVDASDSLTVTIDWGDGSSIESIGVDRLADAFDVAHQYAGAGMFDVTVTVSDNHGSTAQQTTTAVVQGAGLVGETLYYIGSDGRDKLWVDETWVYDGSGWWWNPNNWDRRIVASGRIDGTWFSEVVDPASVASLNIFTLGGNDRVVVSHDAGLPVMVDAGAGNDFVWICSGNASVHAGAGNDVVWTGAGNDFVDGGAGNDEIWTDGGRDTIVDMNGNNSVVSGGGADTITTGAGDDLIWSEGGSDIIDAGDGNNFVNSGGGADRVTTGSGDDWVELGGGDDVAILGSGNDTALGGVGNDALIGEAGDDDLRGGRGNDLLIGGIGSDQLRGGKDDDLLIAGSTIFDSDATAIDAIMSEWSRDAAYAARIMNLRNGTGSHLNGVALVAGATVIEDDDDDVLRGQHGQDWFFASQTNDQIRGREDDEEVDWWNI